MWHAFSQRSGHYALLLTAYFLLTLPNLGNSTLWDMDEGVNAEASREMLEYRNWITPHFNYQLRTAKPVLLNWLQATAMLLFGINEWSARIPSVLCGLGTVLLTYELARKMFAPSTGLLAGLVLASCIEFCMLSHAATPDAPLLFFLVAAMTLYWFGSVDGRRWWYAPVGVAVGFAVLTKGPIGIVLTGATIGLHLLWTKQYRVAFSWRVFILFGAIFFTAAPWYALVAMETKGQWIAAFFKNENLNRFSTPQENHKGGPWYHPLLLVVLFAPWSIFIGVTFWNAIREVRRRLTATEPTKEQSAYRFLLCWFGVVLVLFSIAATKLPNYVLPLYPALAIMTAVAVDRWRTGVATWPRWLVRSIVGAWAFVGVITVFGILLAGGVINLALKGFIPMPALAPWAWLGLFPIVSALACALWVKQDRTRAIGSLVVGSVLYLAGMAGFPTVAMNEYKAPQHFVQQFKLDDPNVEMRLAGLHWIRQSIVFYARRELIKLDNAKDANARLELDLPTYVFVPAKLWVVLQPQITAPHTEMARHFDMYSRDDIILIANPAGVKLAEAQRANAIDAVDR